MDYKNKTSEELILIIKQCEKYKKLFLNSLDIIIVTDIEGKIIETTNSVESTLGYKPEYLIGQHISDLFFQEDTLESLQLINIVDKVITGRKIKLSSGEYLFMDITIETLDFGTYKLIVTTLRDASERFKHENELKQMNDQLSESNKTKDKFFSIIAHDLKSPLTALLGYSEMLYEDATNFSLDEIIEYSRNMNNVSKNLFELLENLLSWSRIQRGSIDFEPELIEFTPLVKNIENLYAARFEQKNITFTKEIADDDFIFADSNMLLTILRNLISNSIKFTPNNGTIKINFYQLQNFSVIDVFDNGIGLSKEMINEILITNGTKSRPGTDKEKGTGLGLLLSCDFIYRHNGTLDIKSIPNQETIFKIILPHKPNKE